MSETKTRAGQKVQTQLLVLPGVRKRLDALAVATGYPRAEMLRRMVDTALPKAERENADNLALLDAVAGKFGMDRAGLVETLERDKLRLADVEKLDAYPGPLAA